jgi:hypothetical protein
MGRDHCHDFSELSSLEFKKMMWCLSRCESSDVSFEAETRVGNMSWKRVFLVSVECKRQWFLQENQHELQERLSVKRRSNHGRDTGNSGTGVIKRLKMRTPWFHFSSRSCTSALSVNATLYETLQRLTRSSFTCLVFLEREREKDCHSGCFFKIWRHWNAEWKVKSCDHYQDKRDEVFSWVFKGWIFSLLPSSIFGRDLLLLTINDCCHKRRVYSGSEARPFFEFQNRLSNITIFSTRIGTKIKMQNTRVLFSTFRCNQLLLRPERIKVEIREWIQEVVASYANLLSKVPKQQLKNIGPSL